jgi:NADPH-dependent curcumin reductase CurA
MASETVESIYLSEYVLGSALTQEHFALKAEALRPLEENEVLIETMHLSVDPYMRGSMTGLTNYYLPQYELDRPIHSVGVGRVLQSRHAGFAPGEVVSGSLEWSTRSIWHPTKSAYRRLGGQLRRIPVGARTSHMLGVMGANGLTAFFGVLAVARPRPRETMLISSAAGGVGTVAGQIAKLRGAHVVGLTSTETKCHALVEQLGFDAAINYRDEDFPLRLLEELPNGPDIYFDNVGGDLSQTIMNTMHRPARVIECGQIATYDDPDGGWRVDIRPIHGRGLQWESFTPGLFTEYEPAALAQLSYWVETGRIKVLESEYIGLPSAPTALIDILNGGNIGKGFVTLPAAGAEFT